MFNLVQILVPLGVCVALPVLIVWLISRAQMNKNNRQADVLIEAIKANNQIDADMLVKLMMSSRKTFKEILNGRLLRGCIFSLIGLLTTVFSLCMYGMEIVDSDDFAFLLFAGIILLAVGVSYLIVYLAGKKQLNKENDPEEQQ